MLSVLYRFMYFIKNSTLQRIFCTVSIFMINVVNVRFTVDLFHVYLMFKHSNINNIGLTIPGNWSFEINFTREIRRIS